ncbi:methyltransferase domain-containing protein [Desulfoplanes formicivorans]|uniref:Methyltransferase type 11 n=1 Tax=Desulfoplanes formicivorans TaxID=1592317 RepID=A0A194AFY8_9BACT|nr:methyltransferase domain-containing protein [Desulfoplanes formicivorans]GAU08997.1 methyltransferase type 11 [Desulfoplanes formicivorans]
MKSRIRNAFDRASRSYEKWALVQQDVAHDCARLVADTTYDTVLEIGSGAGFLTGLLVPRIRPRVYLALDLAHGMVKKPIFSSLPCVMPLVGDGETPPLQPLHIDLLVSASSLQWYLDPERSIPANLALLRPGGDFVLALFVDGTLKELGEVSRKTGFGSVFPLHSVAFYERIMSGIRGIRWKGHTRELVWHYDSVGTFLRSQQGTGAKATPGMGRIGRRRYAAFCREYAARYRDKDGVRATYEVLYLQGHRERE